MPNWCCTSTAIIAQRNNERDVEQLHKLHSVFTSHVEKQEGANGAWIGNYLYALGILPERDNGLRSFIAEVEDITTDGDVEYFIIRTDDAWEPKTMAFDMIISAREFSGLSYVYVAEEPGCGIYVNTDEDRIIFKDSYKIECPEGYLDFDIEYFETEDAFLATLDDVFGILANSFEESVIGVEEFCKNNNRGVEVYAFKFENPNI